MTDKAEPAPRRGFHHYLTPASYAGWVAAAAKYNVSMTALVEIVGIVLAEGDRLTSEEVAMALQVDRDRRVRRRD